MKRPF